MPFCVCGRPVLMNIRDSILSDGKKRANLCPFITRIQGAFRETLFRHILYDLADMLVHILPYPGI